MKTLFLKYLSKVNENFSDIYKNILFLGQYYNYNNCLFNYFIDNKLKKFIITIEFGVGDYLIKNQSLSDLLINRWVLLKSVDRDNLNLNIQIYQINEYEIITIMLWERQILIFKDSLSSDKINILLNSKSPYLFTGGTQLQTLHTFNTSLDGSNSIKLYSYNIQNLNENNIYNLSSYLSTIDDHWDIFSYYQNDDVLSYSFSPNYGVVQFNYASAINKINSCLSSEFSIDANSVLQNIENTISLLNNQNIVNTTNISLTLRNNDNTYLFVSFFKILRNSNDLTFEIFNNSNEKYNQAISLLKKLIGNDNYNKYDLGILLKDLHKLMEYDYNLDQVEENVISNNNITQVTKQINSFDLFESIIYDTFQDKQQKFFI